MQKNIINPQELINSKAILNVLSQAVLPKLVNKALDALGTKPVRTELPDPQSPVVNTVIDKKDPKITVNVNFFINDPEHKIDPSTYVPIKFIE